mgnify:CR=1 FL=1
MEYFENISFVLIARNECFGVEKCLTSLSLLPLRHCEIICVDSGSTDETMDVMLRFSGVIPNLRIFTIKGYSNAAVARNVGIKFASCDFIFFVDGDVEINPSFISIGINRLCSDVGAITGRLCEIQYTRDFSKTLKIISDRFYIKSERLIYASGGCFITTKSVVKYVGLFDERLEKSQDYDYTLRITRHFFMLAIPISMGIHHTVGYEDRFRFFTQIKKLHALYFGAVLRRNILNFRGIFWLLMSKERGIALGGVLWVMGFVGISFFGEVGFFALCTLIATDLFVGYFKGNDLLYRLYLHYFFPILTFIGFMHIPDRRSEYSVEEIDI